MLRVTPHINERTRRPCTLVRLLTAKVFASFRYELAVEDRQEGATLHLKVLGLKAPQLDLPAAGPAEFRREYEGWQGEQTIIVYGLDGSSTTVAVTITPGGISAARPVPPGIVEVETPKPSTNRHRAS
jgi:hypothetical protein